MDGELVKPIQLNVRIGNIVLRDQFEWDINNPHNSPEDFAESLCCDLGLAAEFMLPIAHQIREQINEHQRQAHQERRGGYQHLNIYGKAGFGSAADYKSSSKSGLASNRRGTVEEPEQPGKELVEMRDTKGHLIVSETEYK